MQHVALPFGFRMKRGTMSLPPRLPSASLPVKARYNSKARIPGIRPPRWPNRGEPALEPRVNRRTQQPPSNAGLLAPRSSHPAPWLREELSFPQIELLRGPNRNPLENHSEPRRLDGMISGVEAITVNFEFASADCPRDHAGLANIDSASTILSHACHPASPTQSETRNAIIDGFHTLRFLPRA